LRNKLNIFGFVFKIVHVILDYEVIGIPTGNSAFKLVDNTTLVYVNIRYESGSQQDLSTAYPINTYRSWM